MILRCEKCGAILLEVCDNTKGNITIICKHRDKGKTCKHKNIINCKGEQHENSNQVTN